jgi:hypothetical protein
LVKEIRIYVEGGGDKDSKAWLRIAFSQFLGSLKESARAKRIGWSVIACGSRSDTLANFSVALKQHPDALTFLLVDSEGPLACSPAEHLVVTEGAARRIAGVADDQIHLMVEAMEAWIAADPHAVSQYYGQGFKASALPRHKNIEKVSKQDLFAALDAATRGTQKGRYHKTHHAPELIERLTPPTVRKRAPHCDRLFAALEEALAAGDE